MKDYLRKNQPVRFVFPIDGDCINSADGKRDGNDLLVTVKVAAPESAEVYVNDVPAQKQGEYYQAEIRFENYRTSLTAVDTVSGESDTIAVYKLRAPEKKFRLSSDDNILFLKDIAKNQDKYTSIFDNPYLKMYKRAHDATGVCVHLNLFYETGADPTAEGYFNLTMVPDKYKNEWAANSDWLRLSFHSRTNEPLWPYKNTTHSKLYNDAKLVHKEILRFAGEKSLAKTTTLHFGSTNVTGVRALRSLGYQTLAAYFEFDNEGNTMVAYHYPKDLVAYLGERDFWKDTEEDVMYCRIDRVLNLAKTVDGNLDVVKEVVKNPTRGKFIELMIHEQYFYETYYAYIPDFGDIIYENCKWLKEQGYTSTFMQDVISEN